MKKKRYITYFLFFISMVMLAVPVIPHHHHSDGLVCMKDDLAANCCEHRHTPADKHCCNTGCVTTNSCKNRQPISIMMHGHTPIYRGQSLFSLNPSLNY